MLTTCPNYLNASLFTNHLSLISRCHCSVSPVIFALKNPGLYWKPIVSSQHLLIHCFDDQRALKVNNCAVRVMFWSICIATPVRPL